MISILCFKWSKPGYRAVFTGEHVNILRDMVRRNTTVPHRFICVTDDPRGIDVDIEVIKLWENPAPGYGRENRPNCFYRLKCFDPDMKSVLGDRFLWLDLDTVIMGNIDHILNDPAEFKIWRPDGGEMPCNGSMLLHKTGTRPHLWTKFDAARVCPVSGLKKVNGFMGSDQSWIAENLMPQDQTFSKKDGVFSYRMHTRCGRLKLDPGAKIVFFHGRHNPWDTGLYSISPWIAQHYKRDYAIVAVA